MLKLVKTSTISLSLNTLLKGQLKFLSKNFNIIGIASPGPDLNELASREGCNIIAVNMERQISPFKDLVSLIKLYFLLRRERPDIIHSITPKAGLLSMLAGKAAGVPIRMHTFTGLVFPTRTGAMQKILIAMDRLLCWAATNIYPEGQGVRNDLINYKITGKPLKVLANGNVNGIDTTHFSPEVIGEDVKAALRASLDFNADDFVFVFVGRLVGDKGINELVASFSQIRKSANPQIRTSANPQIRKSAHPHIRIKLLLVGPLETELDPLLPETLQEIENNSAILSVGFQSDVRSYLAISDALVFPSYREGFPNVVMQAGAMGLPSIVTDINGCNEIIEEGKNGLIVPAKDENALANAMARLIEDVPLYDRLQSNARGMITSRYEQHVVWEALLEEYQRLIEEHKNNK